MIYHLVIEQFAMENGPLIVDLPIKTAAFSFCFGSHLVCLNLCSFSMFFLCLIDLNADRNVSIGLGVIWLVGYQP